MAAADEEDTVTLSTFGANTLGPAWFDAVTPLTGAPGGPISGSRASPRPAIWTPTLNGCSPLAEADRNGFVGWRHGIVTGAVSLHYEMERP